MLAWYEAQINMRDGLMARRGLRGLRLLVVTGIPLAVLEVEAIVFD
jgi:hypothetical protein